MFGLLKKRLSSQDAVNLADDLAIAIHTTHLSGIELVLHCQTLFIDLVDASEFEDHKIKNEEARAIIAQAIHWASQHEDLMAEKIAWFKWKNSLSIVTEENQCWFSPDGPGSPPQLSTYQIDDLYLKKTRWRQQH